MPGTTTITKRLAGRWRRLSIEHFARREFQIHSDVPYVSFTFDDFPRSALTAGGRILADQGARGTYFVSLDLLDGPSVSGQIASRGDLAALLHDGHELGCHTFEHLDGTKASVEAFESSIRANRETLAKYGLAPEFSVFAYPLDGPVLAIKRAVSRHFAACRSGGQIHNTGRVDLNLLKAFFLDKRSREDLEAIRTLIDANTASRGWLIFATHDVACGPSDYGCSPELFESVVTLARRSGARILPMTQVCRELGIVQ